MLKKARQDVIVAGQGSSRLILMLFAVRRLAFCCAVRINSGFELTEGSTTSCAKRTAPQSANSGQRLPDLRQPASVARTPRRYPVHEAFAQNRVSISGRCFGNSPLSPVMDFRTESPGRG